MGIHIHSGSLRLFQQHFQIPQVVAGNQDTGIFPDADIHPCDLRISVGFRVGPVQQSHAGDAVLSGFHRQGDQLLHTEAVIQRSRQRPLEEGIDLTVILHQCIRVL